MAISLSMQTTDPDRLDVVVGVIENANGEYLIQQRLPDKPCAGQWEFPGGKIETDETPMVALCRELWEELDISVKQSTLLLIHQHEYSHAKVQLHVFLVTRYMGKVTGKEGQNFLWLDKAAIANMDVLGAVHPILKKL